MKIFKKIINGIAKYRKDLFTVLVIIMMIIFSFVYSNYYLFFSTILLLILLIMFTINYNNDKVKLCIYFFVIVIILFFREKQVEKIDDISIFKYLVLAFKYRVILINVIGNIILYIPLLFYLDKNKYLLLKLILLFIIIIFFEFLQRILQVGVFDIKDIILNIFGCLMYMSLRGYRNVQKKKSRKNQ